MIVLFALSFVTFGLMGLMPGDPLDIACAANPECTPDNLEQMKKLEVENFPIHHSLSLEQMQQLGLYISNPRSPKETDHPFAEPGVFVINEHGTVQVVDISNNPFVRPSLDVLTSGLAWIRSHEYPIRGTF